MTHIITFIRNFSTNAITTIFSSDLKREVFVGRWSIPNTNNNIIINRIVDRNNEDHCGVCTNDEKQEILNNNEHKKIDDDDNYYRIFFM